MNTTHAQPPVHSLQHELQQTLQRAAQIILGKPAQLRLALCCLLAGGHLLIEDLPGVGKTTLAHLLARWLMRRGLRWP